MADHQPPHIDTATLAQSGILNMRFILRFLDFSSSIFASPGGLFHREAECIFEKAIEQGIVERPRQHRRFDPASVERDGSHQAAAMKWGRGPYYGVKWDVVQRVLTWLTRQATVAERAGFGPRRAGALRSAPPVIEVGICPISNSALNVTVLRYR